MTSIPASLSPVQAQAYMDRVFAHELSAVEGPNHPMRYQLRKSSSNLTTTKEIMETKDGDVALLIAVNGQPLSPAAEHKEQARLDGLLSDPSRQQSRSHSEDADTARARKVLRALPKAFLYQYAGPAQGPAGEVEKFTFRPNPAFRPFGLDMQVLTALAGSILVDPAAERVVRLDGHLQHGVDFGWGILGRLDRGGWIAIEDANVYGKQWRIVHIQIHMNGRVLFRSRNFDMVEDESHFES
ncbi:MAG: hypothetical protein ACREKE_07750, partial [bacterium]